jgi:hypothetical protein
LFKAEFVANITKVSSFKNINFVQDKTISQRGDNKTISLAYDSLGEPSCAIIWSSSRSDSQVSFGTNQAYCMASFPSIKFIDVFNKTNNSFINFKLMLSMNGSVTVNFLIKNDLESIKLTTTVTVSSYICQKPNLDIVNRASDFLNPISIMRSKIFSVVSKTELNCNVTLKSTKKWLIYEINANTASIKSLIDLADIISAFSAEIFIPGNFLNYGTYRFIYQVLMDGEANSFFETVDTFIHIVPTGIAIFPFSGGIKEITIGMGQSIDLDPGRYSYDFDDLLGGTQLIYRFYCRLIIDGLPESFPGAYFNSLADLQQIKDGGNIQIQTKMCFKNSSKDLT